MSRPSIPLYVPGEPGTSLVLLPGPARDTRLTCPRSGAIFLQASTRPFTAPADFSNISRSAPVSSISTMRSTPFAPITTGTPT